MSLITAHLKRGDCSNCAKPIEVGQKVVELACRCSHHAECLIARANHREMEACPGCSKRLADEEKTFLTRGTTAKGYPDLSPAEAALASALFKSRVIDGTYGADPKTWTHLKSMGSDAFGLNYVGQKELYVLRLRGK